MPYIGDLKTVRKYRPELLHPDVVRLDSLVKLAIKWDNAVRDSNMLYQLNLQEKKAGIQERISIKTLFSRIFST